jgi:hypothetical protein
VKSHDYHVLLTQMIAVGIQNILTVNVQKAIMHFCFFFNTIGQKVLSEEALESSEKCTIKSQCKNIKTVALSFSLECAGNQT